MAISGGPSACPRVDTDRVRAQIKRWQERLLDLTKANPLLGLNRSRVSKLKVVDPGCIDLFRTLVLQDDAHLKMPRVVKVAKKDLSAQVGPVEGEPATEEYKTEPGG